MLTIFARRPPPARSRRAQQGVWVIALIRMSTDHLPERAAPLDKSLQRHEPSISSLLHQDAQAVTLTGPLADDAKSEGSASHPSTTRTTTSPPT